jgi:hypothetical protein
VHLNAGDQRAGPDGIGHLLQRCRRRDVTHPTPSKTTSRGRVPTHSCNLAFHTCPLSNQQTHHKTSPFIPCPPAMEGAAEFGRLLVINAGSSSLKFKVGAGLVRSGRAAETPAGSPCALPPF